jgi:tRNA G10  N-methylase Trm11
MHQYGFLLGREYLLSSAELLSVLEGELEIVCASHEVLVIKTNKELPEGFLNKLGGIIKIFKIDNEYKDVNIYINESVKRIGEQNTGKLQFALNIFNAEKKDLKVTGEKASGKYNDLISRTLTKVFNSSHHFQANTRMTQKDKLLLKNSLKKIKKGLREFGMNSRFVNKPGENARSIAISKEHLDEKRSDLNIVKIGEAFLCGETIAVQNGDLYSRRDYGRPARDSRSGMLPPKLAQIMINISDDGVIYDPFCGSGTILMEGLLHEREVMGSDISKKAVEDSETNVKWLIKSFKTDDKYRIFLKDATTITKKDIGDKKVCIVAEFYLGSPTIGSYEMAVREIKNVEKLLIETLKTMKNLKDSISSIVFALPFYNINKKRIFIENLVEKIENLGYSVSDLNPFKDNRLRKTLTYMRKDQTVGREIIKLVP